MRKLFLTFDVEDFISEESILSLQRILEMLKEHELEGLFFITGQMAEKLFDFPETVNLLNDHQIGFHTSSHSVHPVLFEFTDVENYEKAYEISLLRESAHINPLTGAIEGKGGLYALRALFPQKKIVAFRAPGFCWTPPHLDALKTLGITHDFSTNLSSSTCNYNGMNFYPRQTLYIFQSLTNYKFLSNLLIREVSTFLLHPNEIVKHSWDAIYRKSNPKTLVQPPSKSSAEITFLLRKLDLLFRRISDFQKIRLLEVTPRLEIAGKTIEPTLLDVERYYKSSMSWAKYSFGYQPIFLHKHFIRFFGIEQVRERTTIPNIPK